jgi:TIR domain
MNFDKHLFVSYAHVDDMVTPGDDQGWVTRFHKYLETYLSQSIGEQARIWRDDRLRGNEIFANEIVKQFPQTAVLLSILSPRYIDSEWCLREVDEFCKTAELNGGLTVDDKARVIRVMLRGIPAERREQLPNVLKDALGYEFFQWTDGGHELPLDPAFGSGEAYRRQIYFLADDIADLINRLKQADAGKSQVPKNQKPAIYLAESSYDVRDEREKIRGDLRAHGYAVIPDQLARMPDLESEYISEVNRLLDQCQISIHIIGSVRGKVPDGPSLKSAVQLQNEIAATKSEESGLRRLIWLPENARVEQPEQQAFIQELQKLQSLQRGADLVSADLESFKNAMHSVLQKLERSEPQTSKTEDNTKLVFLICDQRDRPATIPLRKYLRGAGLDVEIPAFEGDAATVRRANYELLTRCDAVVLFYGAGDEAWKRTVEIDLVRMKAHRDGRPLLASYVYLAPPSNDDKRELIELEEPHLINGLDGFPESEMTPILNLLKSRESGSA